MSLVGFRYVFERTAFGGKRQLKTQYFAKSSTGRPIESFDVNDVLEALKFDWAKELVEQTFRELEELMELAFQAGLEQAERQFELELDWLFGLQIHVSGYSSSLRMAFDSVASFGSQLTQDLQIEPRLPASRADVLAATIPGL